MSLYSMKRILLKRNNAPLDCLIFGRGKKSLVLIPGLSFQRVRQAPLSLVWLYRAFSREYTVYVPDKRENIPRGYTVRELAEDTADAMEQLGIGTADIAGISQGGMIAQYLAIDHPGLVNKLVLGVTASRQNETINAVIRRWVALAEQQDYDAIIRDMLPRMYSSAYVKRYGWLFPILSMVGKPKEFDRFIALSEACLTCDTYPLLHKIRCPVFVIGGEQDHVVTGRASEEIAEALHCQLYLYPELGHSAYEEAPDFNARVLDFLSR